MNSDGFFREDNAQATDFILANHRLKPLTEYLTTDATLGYITHWKEAGIANRTIHMEIGVLRRILIGPKRWRDVDLMEHTLIVRHSKTEAGERTPNEFASQIAASRDLTGLQTTESSP